MTPHYYPFVSGPAAQARRISAELEKRGVSSPILTSDVGAEGRPTREVMDGVRVERFHSVGSLLQYSFTPSLYSRLCGLHPDLIHAHGYRSLQTDFCSIYSRLTRKPLVLNAHGTALAYLYIVKGILPKLPYLFYDGLSLRNSLRRPDAVVASTVQEMEELVQMGVPSKKIRIIPPGIDLERYRTHRGADSKGRDLRILFAGRITKDRNLEVILHAFKKISSRYDRLRLRIVGGEFRRTFTDQTGYLDRMKAYARELGIWDRVEFVGQVAAESLVQEYAMSDIFVYPTLYESFGQTVLEAAAAGLPIVATAMGVSRDLIQDGRSGFIIPPNSTEVLADRLERLIVDGSLRARFSGKIRSLVQGYRWDTVVDRYVALYEELL